MEENKKNQPEEVKPPSMFQMMKSFGKELGKWVKEGVPATSPADYIQRLNACKACPHLIEKHMRCGKCGCMIEHKAKWRTTTCPDDPPRWKSLEQGPQTKAEAAYFNKQKIQHEQAILEKEAQEAKRKKLNLPLSEAVDITPEEVEEYKKNKEAGYTDYEDV